MLGFAIPIDREGYLEKQKPICLNYAVFWVYLPLYPTYGLPLKFTLRIIS